MDALNEHLPRTAVSSRPVTEMLTIAPYWLAVVCRPGGSQALIQLFITCSMVKWSQSLEDSIYYDYDTVPRSHVIECSRFSLHFSVLLSDEKLEESLGLGPQGY